MKNNNFLHILLCTIAIITFTSCEKPEVKISTHEDHLKLGQRAPNCNDCEECCCAVQLTSPGTVVISLCGTTNTGTQECEFETTNCQVVDGTLHTFTLVSGSAPLQFFCMDPNTDFSIGSNAVGSSVNITCQYGQLNPQSVNLTFGTPPKNYYNVNGNCEIIDDCF